MRARRRPHAAAVGPYLLCALRHFTLPRVAVLLPGFGCIYHTRCNTLLAFQLVHPHMNSKLHAKRLSTRNHSRTWTTMYDSLHAARSIIYPLQRPPAPGT